jgi:hypothetical protein
MSAPTHTHTRRHVSFSNLPEPPVDAMLKVSIHDGKFGLCVDSKLETEQVEVKQAADEVINAVREAGTGLGGVGVGCRVHGIGFQASVSGMCIFDNTIQAPPTPRPTTCVKWVWGFGEGCVKSV